MFISEIIYKAILIKIFIKPILFSYTSYSCSCSSTARIPAFQAGDPGSNPGGCIVFLNEIKLTNHNNNLVHHN